jgi:hypothetical protein
MKGLKMTIRKYILLFTIMIFSSITNSVEIKFIENQEFFKGSNGMVREQDTKVPVVFNGDPVILKKINDRFNGIVSNYKCNPKADLYFTSKVVFESEDILSVKYNALYSCESMPGPSSYEGGVTFDLTTGEEIDISSQSISDDGFFKISKKVMDNYIELSQVEVKEFELCETPLFSGEYYIERGFITFVNFFSAHYLSFCEIEIKIPLIEVIELFKQSSRIVSSIGIEKSIEDAHAEALRYYKKNNINKSVEVLESYLGGVEYLKYNKNTEKIVNIINDYAFFLESVHRYAEAIDILLYVVSIAPNRVVAYINLADALYDSGRKQESKIHYKKYISQMKKMNKEKKIPARVFSRSGSDT